MRRSDALRFSQLLFEALSAREMAGAAAAQAHGSVDVGRRKAATRVAQHKVVSTATRYKRMGGAGRCGQVLGSESKQ